MDVDPLDPAAALAGVVHRRVHQRGDRRLEVGVFGHVARILAAELQPEPGEGAGRGLFDPRPARDGAGEVDEVEASVRDQRTGGVVVEEHGLEHVLGHARPVEAFGEAFAHQQGLGRVFQHHRIARDERGHDRVDRGHVGVVPGRDHQHHAVRRAADEAAETVAVFEREVAKPLGRDLAPCIACARSHRRTRRRSAPDGPSSRPTPA